MSKIVQIVKQKVEKNMNAQDEKTNRERDTMTAIQKFWHLH